MKKSDDVKLLIAGNGPELDNLKAVVSDRGIENNVIFLGYTLELDKYMNIANVLIACSFREGLPLNLMEAMLCGTPVVASNNRGHRELVDNGKNGFLVSTLNYAEYADRIEEVLTDIDKYSDYAISKVKLFTDVNVVMEIRNLYNL